MKTFDSICNGIYIEAYTLIGEIESIEDEILRFKEDYYVYDKLGLPEEKQSVDCEIESSERILSDKNEKLKELKSRIDKLPRYYRSQLRKVLKKNGKIMLKLFRGMSQRHFPYKFLRK